MTVELSYQEEARQKLLQGAVKAGRFLGTTLGPLGRSVVIQKQSGSPKILDNGVAAAEELELSNRFENAGAKMLQDVSRNTSQDAGDGTTTSAVLAEAIFREGIKRITSGISPMALRRGLERGGRLVSNRLREMSEPVDITGGLQTVATNAAKGDEELGDLIATALEEAGSHGVVTIEEGTGIDSSLSTRDGMQLENGFLTADFASESATGEIVLKNAYVLCCEETIADARKLLPLLKAVGGENRPLLVIARDVIRGALGTMVVNNNKGVVNCVAVKAPGQGPRRKENLQDISLLTGGTPILEELGLDLRDIDLEQLGEAKEIRIDDDVTRITGGAGNTDRIHGMIDTLTRQIREEDSRYDRKRLKERKARLATGLSEIYVGGKTKTERDERISRARDGLNAARAARREGVVPGGGIGLIRAADVLDRKKGFQGDEIYAVDLLQNALKQPFRQIVLNAGYDPDLALRKILNNEGSYGFNVETGEFTDLVEDCIVDPTVILQRAVENASSISGLFFTTECLIT